MKTFKDIKIGTQFYFCGTLWQKRSSRTALVVGMPHRWFYFSNERIRA